MAPVSTTPLEHETPPARPESQPSGGLGDGRQPPEGVGAKPLDGRAAAATVAARSGGGSSPVVSASSGPRDRMDREGGS